MTWLRPSITELVSWMNDMCRWKRPKGSKPSRSSRSHHRHLVNQVFQSNRISENPQGTHGPTVISPCFPGNFPDSGRAFLGERPRWMSPRPITEAPIPDDRPGLKPANPVLQPPWSYHQHPDGPTYTTHARDTLMALLSLGKEDQISVEKLLTEKI